jgi:acetyl esterase/lipase
MTESREPDLIPLWPKGLPDDDIRHDLPERIVNRDADLNAAGLNRAISNVIDPGMYVYPCETNPSGDVVLVCPGGGYHHVTVDKEGHDVATWLNVLGISAVVLKYRTRPEGVAKSRELDDPVLRAIERDAQQAMQTIKREATNWHIKLSRLGVMGFSAGSNLAIRLAMASVEEATPDFLALIYSSVPPGAGKAVDTSWPPVFFTHANDDTTTPMEGVLDLYDGCRKHNIRTELHVYPEGGHAFGLGVRGGSVADWPNRFAAWIQSA